MTTQHVELPQALHVALLNCQAAHDARSRTFSAHLDAEISRKSRATISRLWQAHTQAVQQADAAFRALGRALDAEGGHVLWRIVYLKGGRTRSRVQVRPTRESARRREGQARLDLRRELTAQGAQVQYLVALPVALILDADHWDRAQGMTRLGTRRFAPRASLGGPWAVIAYGQPAPQPEPDLKPCLAAYAPGWDFACTLPQGHDGKHEDHATDAPAIVTWYATDASWNIAQVMPREAQYARALSSTGRCPWCQGEHGNRHADTCSRQGIVGELDAQARDTFQDRPKAATRTCSVCGCQEAPSTNCRHWDLGADHVRQDAPCAPRKPQDGRNAPDLTGWAPGEIQEAYGR